MDKFEFIIQQIWYFHIQYIRNIITDIWKQDVEDYWIEILTPWFIDFWDYYISFSDFEWVAKYNIPESIFYEYQDWISLTCETKRCKEFKDSLQDNPDLFPNWNLYLFYAFCMQDDEEWKKYKEEDLKKSKNRVKEVKSLFENCLK